MPNRPRITTVVLDWTEDLTDEQEDAHADGTVTPEEMSRMAEMETTLNRIAVDAAQGVVQGLRLIHVTRPEPQDHNGLVRHISDYITARRAAHADGTITPAEQNLLGQLVWNVYQTAMYADQGVRIAVTAARSGPDSPSLQRQLNEIRLERERMSARPRLTVLKGGREIQAL